MLITGVNDIGDKLFSDVNDTAKTLSLTPAIDPCHGFSLIAGANNTS
jgi:hypothetical protein